MILSVESGHKRQLDLAIVDKVNKTQQTFRGIQNSVEWTIDYLAGDREVEHVREAGILRSVLRATSHCIEPH